MTKTMTAITSSRWINPPPTWPRKPRSQRIRRITNIVHSINFTSGLISSADYVQPRSKKIRSKIGIGIPRSQSRMYPVAPASLILFIKCMFVLSLERFTGSQFPFGVLLWICPVSFGAGPEVPHLSLRQTLGRCRSIDRTFVSVCLSLHSNRL